jgi:1-acyl-sn-glycerol-3-phosphate acyltransferase
MTKCLREVKFIGAAKSVRKPFLGQILKSIGVIPVERP